jgi:hypothetical protein
VSPSGRRPAPAPRTAGWSKAKAALDKAIAESAPDLRRTSPPDCSALASGEVTEAVLNHISGSRGGIAGVYQRHDWAAEKAAALEAWAAHVTAAVEGNVVKLTRVG